MCGKAPLFQQALEMISRGYALLTLANNGGIAATI
jgi:hypothetical protein